MYLDLLDSNPGQVTDYSDSIYLWHSLQANTGTVPVLGHGHFLPNPSSTPISLPLNVKSLDTESDVK
jgi:hypothetical protein